MPSSILHISVKSEIVTLPSVTHYQCRPRPANFSLESIFHDVRARLEDELKITVRIAPCFSNGILRRIRIMLDAWSHRREAMHVTGDINFAVLLRSRERTVLTILDCGDLLSRSDWRRSILKLFWFDLPVRKAAHITTISETSKNDIIARRTAQRKRSLSSAWLYPMRFNPT